MPIIPAKDAEFSKVDTRFKPIHGMTGTGFHKTFCSMKERCENKNNNRYKNYGGRGIKVLWPDFVSFRDDMYESYEAHKKEFGEKQTTIDRIDPDKDYCKENCRWATYREQALNKKTAMLISFEGRTQHLSEWATEIGVLKGTLWNRIKRGWPLERALNKEICP